MQSEPRNARIPVWALPLSLAATEGIDVSFSSSGYLDVSVPRVPSDTLCIRVNVKHTIRARERTVVSRKIQRSSSEKEHKGNALASGAEEGRDKLR